MSRPGPGSLSGESRRVAIIFNAFHKLPQREDAHLARRKGNEAVCEVFGAPRVSSQW